MVREPKKPIITVENVKPSQDFLRVEGIFNCGAARLGEEYLLLCRVAESCAQQEDGFLCIPVYDEAQECLKKERIPLEELKRDYDLSDSRKITSISKSGGKKVRCLTSISHLRLARSRDGVTFRVDDHPALPLKGRYERWGMEDPRITRLEDEDRYCIAYTAVSDLGAMPALLITKDFVEFKRIGVIFPPENKDVVIFPKKIGGLYYAFHRPVPCAIGTPDIWMSSSPDLKHWGGHRHVSGVCRDGWENGRVGSGAPPIYTPEGWLHIYHGADADNRYCLGAMLTDLEDPGRVLAKAEKPILEPQEPYEAEGFFGGVVFACGCIVEGDDIFVYYGAADDKIARARVSLQELLTLLTGKQPATPALSCREAAFMRACAMAE